MSIISEAYNRLIIFWNLYYRTKCFFHNKWNDSVIYVKRHFYTWNDAVKDFLLYNDSLQMRLSLIFI